MGAKVKICGLMRRADVEAVNELLPDYAGFVLTGGFSHSICEKTFFELIRELDGRIRRVGVFVDEPQSSIASFGEYLDMIQLHGAEDDETIRRVRELTGKPVIKAFVVKGPDDIDRAKDCPADYVLLDAGTGSGVSFDHSLIKDFPREYFLAGGLGADNTAHAVEALHPYAVDASSRLETEGRKDITKMAAYVNAARGSDNE